jgi:hypothetical protein
VEELHAWLGMHILMGIHCLPELKNYWCTDPALGVRVVSDVMTTKRFKKILEALHCNDNYTNPPRGDPNHDKIHKVRPIIDKLNKTCNDNYQPSAICAVDESMIPFKGRSTLKQYMPMKPVKRGYKVWVLADSMTGYVINFEMYVGKSRPGENDSVFANTLGERVVLSLVKNIKHTNCLLAFDNFFTSFDLMKALYADGIYACGTVRTNRKGLPPMLKSNDKLKRGEFMFAAKGNVAATKWMDNKAVSMLSTAHSPRDTTTVKRKNKDGSSSSISCPVVVESYNRIMGAVDRFDQLKERYAIGRRSVKWWHRFFFIWLMLPL